MKTIHVEWATIETHSALINVPDEFDSDSADLADALAEVSDELDTWDGSFERQDIEVYDRPYQADAPYFDLG